MAYTPAHNAPESARTTTTAELISLTIAGAAALLSTKRISSTELTEAYLTPNEVSAIISRNGWY